VARTYEPIASTAFTSSTAQVEFTSIPGTYTDLVLIGISRGGSLSQALNFNGVGGVGNTTYSQTRLYGTGSSAASDRYSNASQIDVSHTTSATSLAIAKIAIQQYANTNVFKTVLVEHAAPENAALRTVGLFRSTNAITSIKLFPYAGTYAEGTFSLYGIKAA
jgi:hypothetical protein